MQQVRVTLPATRGALKVMPQARVVRATTQPAPFADLAGGGY